VPDVASSTSSTHRNGTSSSSSSSSTSSSSPVNGAVRLSAAGLRRAPSRLSCRLLLDCMGELTVK
jgi:hypothetical protein